MTTSILVAGAEILSFVEVKKKKSVNLCNNRISNETFFLCISICQDSWDRLCRPLVNSVYQKLIFLFLNQHML